jgi:hypothetical protein
MNAWAIALAAGLLLISQPRAPVDFSGTWTIVKERSVWHASDGRAVDITVFGERFTIEQTAITLLVAIDEEDPFQWQYPLDGGETRNLPPGPRGRQETRSTAAWSGEQLTITTWMSTAEQAADGPRSTTRRLTLNEDGTLTVEAPWGHDGALIGSIYRKVSDR